MVAWLVHPPPTHLHLILLLWLKPMTMKEKKAENKMKTMSKAS
jgi:hypothetical protein